MAHFIWSEEYSVNIKAIDEQHKGLIDLIEKLHTAMLNRQSRAVMGDILSELVNYTNSHFAYEEELMEKYGYPGFHEHKKHHQQMRHKVLALQDDYGRGKIVVSMQVMDFLKDWLARHILGTDQLYKEFLNSEGVF